MGFIELLWECKRVVIFGPKALKGGAFVGWRTQLVTVKYQRSKQANWGAGSGSRTWCWQVGGAVFWIFSSPET